MSEIAAVVSVDDIASQFFPSDFELEGGLPRETDIDLMWLTIAHTGDGQLSLPEPDETPAADTSAMVGRPGSGCDLLQYQDAIESYRAGDREWFRENMPGLDAPSEGSSPATNAAEMLNSEEHVSQSQPTQTATIVDSSRDDDDSGDFDPTAERRQENADRRATKRRMESLRQKRQGKSAKDYEEVGDLETGEAPGRSCDRCLGNGRQCLMLPVESTAVGQPSASCIACEMDGECCVGGIFSSTGTESLDPDSMGDAPDATIPPTKDSNEDTGRSLNAAGPSEVGHIEVQRPKITSGSKLWKPVIPLGLHVSPSCAFCSSGLYTMLGEEYCDEPSEPGTKLCKTCFSKRNAIAQCGDHLISRSKTLRKVDFEKMADRLMKDRKREDDPWCDVCPSMAQFECRKVAEWGRGQCGCGLKLCKACAEDLATHNNSWKAFMVDMFARPWRRPPFGIRADAEILVPGAQLGR